MQLYYLCINMGEKNHKQAHFELIENVLSYHRAMCTATANVVVFYQSTDHECLSY